MNRFFSLMMISVLLITPVSLLGQTEKKIIDNQNFSVRTIDASSGAEKGVVTIKLKAEYNTKSDAFTISNADDPTGTLFTLNAPLNRTEFRNKLSENLNKIKSTSDGFSEYDLERIFLWVYSLKQDDLGPEIGRLQLREFAQPFTNPNTNNDTTRIKRLETLTDRYRQMVAISNTLKTKVAGSIAEINKLVNASSPDTALVGIFDPNNMSIYNDLDQKLKTDTYLSFASFQQWSSSYNLDSEIRRIADTLTNQIAANYGRRPLPSAVYELRKNVQNIASYVDDYRNALYTIRYLKETLTANKIFPIEKISIQFERGYLERIQVWVQNERSTLDIYENIYAIGFSSIVNYKTLHSTRLFIRNAVSEGGIFLSDVLQNYDNQLDLYTRDYSPADTAINEIKPEVGYITLRKESNIRLFDSKIYSDLQGISPEAPNGLIQIEVSRRFNFKTFRRQIGTRSDFNYFSYLTVYGALTKIENKVKDLPLKNSKTIVNNVIVSPSYISNLDLRRFENANLGLEWNMFLFDYPDGKFTATLDGGIRYGHVRLGDSTYSIENGIPSNPVATPPFSGHTISLAPRLGIEFFSERRVGFNIAYSFFHTYALTNNRFKQIMSYAKSDPENIFTERAARNSHMFEVFLRIETSHEGNGQLFLRNRLFWQKGDANTSFVQTQVGYAYNIIFRK